MVRQGQPVLLLLFPDGSRRFVPVAWTDAGPDPVTAPRRQTLAPLQELLRARAIIDDLLQRLPAAKEIPNAPPADTSTGHSTAAAAVPRRPRPQPSDLGAARPSATRQAALSVLARILTGATAAPAPQEEPRD